MGMQGNTQGWAALLWQKLRELPAESAWWLAAVDMKTIPKCCPTKVARISSGGKRNSLHPRLVEPGWLGRHRGEHSLPSL